MGNLSDLRQRAHTEPDMRLRAQYALEYASALTKAGSGQKGAFKVGDTVVYQLFNTPEGRFYGPTRTGKITRIDAAGKGGTRYYVEGGPSLGLQRKEIKRRA